MNDDYKAKITGDCKRTKLETGEQRLWLLFIIFIILYYMILQDIT